MIGRTDLRKSKSLFLGRAVLIPSRDIRNQRNGASAGVPSTRHYVSYLKSFSVRETIARTIGGPVSILLTIAFRAFFKGRYFSGWVGENLTISRWSAFIGIGRSFAMPNIADAGSTTCLEVRPDGRLLLSRSYPSNLEEVLTRRLKPFIFFCS